MRQNGTWPVVERCKEPLRIRIIACPFSDNRHQRIGRHEGGRVEWHSALEDVGAEVAVWSENQSSEVRRAAAEALDKLGEHAASAVPALTKCLADGDMFVRSGGS